MDRKIQINLIKTKRTWMDQDGPTTRVVTQTLIHLPKDLKINYHQEAMVLSLKG